MNAPCVSPPSPHQKGHERLPPLRPGTRVLVGLEIAVLVLSAAVLPLQESGGWMLGVALLALLPVPLCAAAWARWQGADLLLKVYCAVAAGLGSLFVLLQLLLGPSLIPSVSNQMMMLEALVSGALLIALCTEPKKPPTPPLVT